MVEVINSYEYRTGYEYSVSGTNMKPDGPAAPMGITTTTNTINGISSRWVGLDPAGKPAWSIVNQGASFQFVESCKALALLIHPD